MSHIKDISGKRFGRWIVIRFSRLDVHKNAYWLCKCDCGTERDVVSSSLTTGDSKSCGCQRDELNSKRSKKEFGLSNFTSLYWNYFMGAKHRKLDFLLTKEDFRELVSKPCYYCGIEPLQKYKGTDQPEEFIYNGVDRVDNNKGYTEDNVVTCCKACNIAKHTMTQQEFYDWIIRVYSHMLEKIEK